MDAKKITSAIRSEGLAEGAALRPGPAASRETPTYSLRPLIKADEAFSFAVYASTRAAEMALVDWPQEQKNAFLLMQFNAQHQHYHLHSPQARWQVIEVAGRPPPTPPRGAAGPVGRDTTLTPLRAFEAQGVQGARAVGRLVSDDARDDLILLMDIALLPEYRGRGIGTAILHELLQAADRAGKTVMLHVEPNNPALRLYQRLGFEISAKSGYYLEMKRSHA